MDRRVEDYDATHRRIDGRIKAAAVLRPEPSVGPFDAPVRRRAKPHSGIALADMQVAVRACAPVGIKTGQRHQFRGRKRPVAIGVGVAVLDDQNGVERLMEPMRQDPSQASPGIEDQLEVDIDKDMRMRPCGRGERRSNGMARMRRTGMAPA